MSLPDHGSTPTAFVFQAGPYLGSDFGLGGEKRYVVWAPLTATSARLRVWDDSVSGWVNHATAFYGMWIAVWG